MYKAITSTNSFTVNNKALDHLECVLYYTKLMLPRKQHITAFSLMSLFLILQLSFTNCMQAKWHYEVTYKVFFYGAESARSIL